MGGLPKLLDYFQDRSDKLHELALAKMQIERELELRKAGFEAQERIEHIRSEQLATESAATTQQVFIGAQQAEMQAIYAHDMSLNEGTSQWMKNFRASVRPVITFGFFGLVATLAALRLPFETLGRDADLCARAAGGGGDLEDHESTKLINPLW
jgi:hypothetical protein